MIELASKNRKTHSFEWVLVIFFWFGWTHSYAFSRYKTGTKIDTSCQSYES